MGKKKNFDLISYTQERADHNINPYYWINRVTPITLAQWKVSKYFAPLFFIINSFFIVSLLISINQTAIATNKSFWSTLFDFSDSFASARFVSVLILLALWMLLGISTIQSLIQTFFVQHNSSYPEHKKEKKRKRPKRPKNYK